MDNVVAWTGRERHVAEQAMWRVVKEYYSAKNNGAAVNIWHLTQDMDRARSEAVRELKESESTLGKAG